jgi:hypothetical protein
MLRTIRNKEIDERKNEILSLYPKNDCIFFWINDKNNVLSIAENEKGDIIGSCILHYRINEYQEKQKQSKFVFRSHKKVREIGVLVKKEYRSLGRMCPYCKDRGGEVISR